MIKIEMNIAYVIWEEEDGFVIRCLNYPVTTQGATEEEAISSLEEAVALYMEDSQVPLYAPVGNPKVGRLLVHA